jgi:signal transduction histidine kinase
VLWVAWVLTALLGLLLLAVPAARAAGTLPMSEAERAWVRSHPVVQVAVSSEFPPYYFADERGRYEGFVIDLLERLAQRTGLRMAYQRHERFGDLLEALRSGQADLTPFISASSERLQHLRFARPLFSTQMVWVTPRTLGDVVPDARFGGYRVAVEHGSTADEILSAEFPRTRLQRYDNPERALLAVAAGDADVFVGFRQVAVYYMEKHLTANLALRGTLPVPGTALGPAVRADLPVLAALIDRAVSELSTEEIAALAARWLPRSLLTEPEPSSAGLSEAQRQWVAARGAVRLGFDRNFAPVTFVNAAGGFEGLGADVARAVLAQAGLMSSLEQGGAFADVLDQARRGELDLIVGAARNAERLRDFDFVGPFLRVPTVVVAAREASPLLTLDNASGRRLALLRDHFLLLQLRSRHPSLTLLELDTQAEVLQAVRAGQADLGIGNLKVVNQLLQERHAGALRAVGTVPDGDSTLYFAVPRSQPELAGVLRVALDAVGPDALAQINNRWLAVEIRTGVPWLRVLWVGGGLLVLAALIIGSLLAANRRLQASRLMLREARRVAEADSQARAGFVAYLSHELRGALGGLSAGLKMLADGALPPPRAQALLVAMQNSASGLLALCERTLDFERAVHGGLDLQPAPASLAAVLTGATAPWRVQAETRGLTLTLQDETPPDLVLHCDAVRLGQVLQNLVGNGVKFTARGGVTVQARWRHPTQGGPGELFLAVADTGPGIPPAEQPALFRPYVQGAGGRGQRGGAGLGLAISARLVQAMGGQLRLAATGPQGSRFEVTLPLRPVAAPAPQAAVSVPPA